MSAVHAYGFGRAISLAAYAIELAENEGLSPELVGFLRGQVAEVTAQVDAGKDER